MITESHQIKARKVYFDFSESSVCWMPDDPLCSHIANGINMLLPAGEFWFCRVFNKTLPHISDEKLKQDVIGFVRQEAAHARAHEKVQDFLRENGYDIQEPLNRAHLVFNILLGDKPLGIPFLKGKNVVPIKEVIPKKTIFWNFIFELTVHFSNKNESFA